MFDLTKRPWRKLGRTTAGVVSLAVVTTSLVALTAAGSADASPRGMSARPDAARVQAVGSAVTSAASLLNQTSYTSKIAGTTSDGTDRRVTGTFTPALAKVSETTGDLRIRGTVRAVVHNANGSVTRLNKGYVWTTVTSLNGTSLGAPTAQRSAAPNAAAALAPGACSVLDLVLGPLDLDLLGLQVHLDQVVLTIIAQSGAGQLLGNLLCAVAGLLDGSPLGGLLDSVSNLLNSILAILRA